MKALPQISEAEFEVMKVIWKHAPIMICQEKFEINFECRF